MEEKKHQNITLRSESFPMRRIMLPSVALFVFGVYLSTACPTVYLGDSGELTSAAFSLGVAHNSGYPLYVLLGKLFSFIPFGHVAFRLNLMSTIFAALAVSLVLSIIYEMTTSLVSATVGALTLAFAPLFWQQATCSEVYSLHTFFVAFLFLLLLRWEKEKTLQRMALLAFFTGISLTNHLQTVMLAPAFFFIILTGDHLALLRPRNLIVLISLFCLALSVYLLLPVRTNAGAALHWGDPNTLARFFAHVTGQEHRGSYVFTKSGIEYFNRAVEILGVLTTQFGFLLLLAAVGWLTRTALRWKVFFILVLAGDLFYGVYLNIISVEVTPFGLPSCVALAVLVGLGLAWTLEWVRSHLKAKAIQQAIATALCLIPVIPWGLNYGSCDQSQNYLGYEHAVNVFRTVSNKGTLFVDGDNHIFPIMYSRFVEGARHDMALYDRHGLFFKIKQEKGSLNGFPVSRPATATMEHRIITEERNGIYYAVFNPSDVSLPRGYALVPQGILHEVTTSGGAQYDESQVSPWSRYMTHSLRASFDRDYMTREVTAAYHFALGKHLMVSGQIEKGFEQLEKASVVGYNDNTIHLDMASFLIEQNFLEAARAELKKALLYHHDVSGVYNNWGYLHDKLGEHQEAITYYRKAIALKPQNHTYHNNLGLALLHAGEQRQAYVAFKKSLKITSDQPELMLFLKEQGLHNEG